MAPFLPPGEVDENGDPIVGDTLLMLMNADANTIPFTFPQTNPHHQWQRLFDTADDDAPAAFFDGGDIYDLRDRSSVLFRTYLASPEASVTFIQAETMRKEIRRGTP